MKKLFATSIMCAAALTMAASSAPQFQWGALLDGSTAAGDQATALANSEKGGLFGLFTAGTTDDAITVMLNNSPLFTGSPYSAGTSYANNFCLIRFAKEGSVDWNVHTDSGDFASNSGTVVATSDGGCVAMVKVRHTDGHFDLPINFVSASGKNNPIDWTPTERYYRLVVLKISADGEIEWIKCPEISTDALNDACKDFVADGFNLYKGCVDSEDNVFVPLNLREPMTFGSSTVEPTNVANWNGDSQKAAGSFVVVKLDQNGDYVGTLTFDGDADATYCYELVNQGGSLYGLGTAAGSNELSCQGISFQPSQLNSPVILNFTPDLKVNWLKCYPGEMVGGKYAVQNLAMTVAADNLWICGAFNGKIGNETGFVESKQGTLREGLLIRLDAKDGEWIKGVSSRESTFNPTVANTALTSYMNVLSNPSNSEKVWVYGYGMNATVGSFVREYDAETLEGSAEGSWNLVTGGGVPTAQAVAYDAKAGLCYNTTRGNKAFQPLDGPASEAPNGWGVYTSSFLMPDDMQTGVDGISEINESISINVVSGGIEVLSKAPFSVYDLTGRRVFSQSAAVDSPVTVSLPAGLYICQGRKVLVR